MARSAGVLGLLAVGLAVAVAEAARLDSVSPGTGSPGDLLTITGTDFGILDRPRVWLSRGHPPRRVRLRVESWSDDSVRAVLGHARAGVYDLVLKPGGGEGARVTLPGAFTVSGPIVRSVSPTTAGPGDLVVVSGLHFGRRAGTVTVGGLAARVVEWSGERVTIRCPRGLADGPWTVALANRVGSGALEGGLTVLGRGGARDPRVVFFDDFDHGDRSGKWSSINRQAIDTYDGNRAPSMPLGGGIQSTMGVRFRAHRGMRISFDVKYAGAAPAPPGLLVFMDLRVAPYSNFESVASLRVDAERGIAAYFHGEEAIGSSSFVADGAWHRYSIAVDREGNAEWYRDGVLQASGSGLPTRGPVNLGLSGGAQESRLDNVRVERGE